MNPRGRPCHANVYFLKCSTSKSLIFPGSGTNHEILVAFVKFYVVFFSTHCIFQEKASRPVRISVDVVEPKTYRDSKLRAVIGDMTKSYLSYPKLC